MGTDFPRDDEVEARAEREALEAPDPDLEDDEDVDLPELDLGDDLDDIEPIIDEPPTEPTDVPESEAPLPPELGVSAHFETYEERRRNPLAKRAWRWRLIAANGEPLAASEAYTSRYDAVRGAEAASKAMLGIELAREEDEPPPS